MTSVFLISAALMLIAALAFVLVPLLRGGNGGHPQNETQRRLRALEQARADGILTAEEYAAKRAALNAPAPAASSTPRSPLGFFCALAVALLLPVSAILLYRLIGTPQALDPANLASADTEAGGHGGNMQAAIAQLAEKMKQDPNNAEGWALLGRAYESTQRYAEARDALKHAHDLVPDDTGLMVDYAEALVLSNADHIIRDEALTLIEQALKTDPQNQKGLWLSGIADAQNGKYDSALKKLNALLPQVNDSEVAASVRDQIAQVEAMRDGKAPPAPMSAPSSSAADAPAQTAANAGADKTAASGAHIAVQVTLDPKLKDKVAPGDTLFVFARAASGPPMPLAIARLTAAQLPASVTLTDAMSMMPNMNLSAFPQIVVGARISKSGQATAQSGDLQTLSAPLPNTRAEPVVLTIDQTVP